MALSGSLEATLDPKNPINDPTKRGRSFQDFSECTLQHVHKDVHFLKSDTKYRAFNNSFSPPSLLSVYLSLVLEAHRAVPEVWVGGHVLVLPAEVLDQGLPGHKSVNLILIDRLW